MANLNSHPGAYSNVDDAATKRALIKFIEGRNLKGEFTTTSSTIAQLAGLPRDRATLQSIGRVLDEMGYPRARSNGERIFILSAFPPKLAPPEPATPGSLQDMVMGLRSQFEFMREEISDLKREIEGLKLAAKERKKNEVQDSYDDIENALADLMPQLDGKLNTSQLLAFSGLDCTPAMAIRLGKYLRSIGIQRGRNSKERYYWFKRQKPDADTSSHFAVIDPPF